MRIQIASDLHLEFLEGLFPDYRGVEPCDADVLVLAGDIANGTRVLDLFAGWPCPVVYVPGNHEYYGSDIAALAGSFAQRAATSADVQVLAPGVWIHQGVRFIGCTLWTDYAVFGAALQLAAMAACATRLLDHERIRCGADQPFTPGDALALHQVQRDWLRGELARPFAG
jgi:predicted phosphohydrolase